MVNFLSSFLPNLPRLLIPIYDLQKKAKKKFTWTEEAKKAFNEIKKLLINPPVLKAPTPDGLFRLKSDASREGVGGSLQKPPKPKPQIPASKPRTMTASNNLTTRP